MIQNYRNIRTGLGAAAAAAGAIAGTSAYRASLSENMMISGQKRGHETMSDTIDYGESAFQPDRGQANFNQMVSNSSCKAVIGRYRPNRRKAIEDLLYKYTYRYQSLQGTDSSSAGGAAGYWARGSFPLRHIFRDDGGGIGTYPQIVDLPIYVFRLNTPMVGYQTCYPSSGVGSGDLPLNLVAPLIGYQLTMDRASNTVTPTYKWRSVTPSQNIPFGAATTNTGHVVLTETNQRPVGSHYRWEGSRAEVLVTLPTQRPCAVTVADVVFTKDAFAPPDQYQTFTSQVENIRPNSGAWDIGAPGALVPIGPESEPERLEASAFWYKFIAAHDGHPLRHVYGPVTRIPVFRYIKKYTQDFSPKATINNISNIQHKHVHSISSGGYIDTSLVDKSPLSVMVIDPVEDQKPATRQTNFEAGVFPQPSKARWLMVHAFTRGGPNPSDANFSAAFHPSFDISISNTFCTSEVKELPGST